MRTPSDWPGPVFLMNFPLSVSNIEPNNAWMTLDEMYDVKRACEQWLALYQRIAREALVYVLPGHNFLQDLPFVANIGCILSHLVPNVALLSRFASKPRIGEEEVGRRFFENCHYDVCQPPNPFRWEGEADLKHVRGNLYVGGINQRSTRGAFNWMRRYFDMEVIEITLLDPKLYHLDCVFHALSSAKALVNTSALSPKDIRKLEDIIDIIEVPEEYKYDSWTNCVVLGKTLLHSAISSADAFAKFLEDKVDLDLECFDLREFEKSGADLSCLVMHLSKGSPEL